MNKKKIIYLIIVFVFILILFTKCKKDATYKVFYANYGCAHIFKFSDEGKGVLLVGEYEVDLNLKADNIYNISFEKEFTINDSNLKKVQDVVKKINSKSDNINEKTKKGAWHFGLIIDNKLKVSTYGDMMDNYNQLLRIMVESAESNSSFDCSEYK